MPIKPMPIPQPPLTERDFVRFLAQSRVEMWREDLARVAKIAGSVREGAPVTSLPRKEKECASE